MNKTILGIIFFPVVIASIILGIYLGPYFVYLIGGGKYYFTAQAIVGVVSFIPFIILMVVLSKQTKTMLGGRNILKLSSAELKELNLKNDERFMKQYSGLFIFAYIAMSLSMSGIITTAVKGMDDAMIWGNCIMTYTGDHDTHHGNIYSKFGVKQSETGRHGRFFYCFADYHKKKIAVVYAEDEYDRGKKITVYTLNGVIFDENGQFEKRLEERRLPFVESEHPSVKRSKVEQYVSEEYLVNSGYSTKESY